mgnify:CR=1 FL=1
MNDTRIEIGKKIKHYRELANLSQHELAMKAGYKSKASICKIEAGLARVPAYKLIDIANVLGVSVPEFLGRELPEYDYHATNSPAVVCVEDEENSGDRLQHILLILAQMNDKQIAKAENILSTIFEED